YDELRKLAAVKLAQEMPGQTLQATALVHEAYLRLLGGASDLGAGEQEQSQEYWNSRGHFFGAAAEAMRRILVGRAGREQAAKRGGRQQRIELTDVPASQRGAAIDLLALDEALS